MQTEVPPYAGLIGTGFPDLDSVQEVTSELRVSLNEYAEVLLYCRVAPQTGFAEGGEYTEADAQRHHNDRARSSKTNIGGSSSTWMCDSINHLVNMDNA